MTAVAFINAWWALEYYDSRRYIAIRRKGLYRKEVNSNAECMLNSKNEYQIDVMP